MVSGYIRVLVNIFLIGLVLTVAPILVSAKSTFLFFCGIGLLAVLPIVLWQYNNEYIFNMYLRLTKNSEKE